MNYKELVAEIINAVHTIDEPEIGEVERTIKNEIESYDVKPENIKDGTARDDVAYKDMIWGILRRLRQAKYIDYEYCGDNLFDTTLEYHADCAALSEVARVLEARTDEFNTSKYGGVDVSGLKIEEDEEERERIQEQLLELKKELEEAIRAEEEKALKAGTDTGSTEF